MTSNLPTRTAPVGSAIADASLWRLRRLRREPMTAAGLLTLVREMLRDHGHPTEIGDDNVLAATLACRGVLEALRVPPAPDARGSAELPC